MMRIELADIFKGLQLDPLLSTIEGHPVYDIFEVDARLHELVGNYEDDHKSMEDVVHEVLSPADAAKFSSYLGL